MTLSLEVREGISLKSALRRLLPLPDYKLDTLLHEGWVRVDDQRVRKNSELRLGQSVSVSFSEKILPSPTILFQEGGWLAVEKQPGIEVNGNCGLTLERLLQAKGYDAQACHRLDVWTGGIVLMALSDTAKNTAVKVWHTSITKEYDAILAGTLPDTGDLHRWLRKDNTSSNVRIYDTEVPGSLPIHTEYRILERTDTLSYTRIRLHTGRTHQIRSQMAQLNAPVLGDDQYGNRTVNKRFHVIRPCLWERYLHFADDLPKEFKDWAGKTLESKPVFPPHVAEFWHVDD